MCVYINRTFYWCFKQKQNKNNNFLMNIVQLIYGRCSLVTKYCVYYTLCSNYNSLTVPRYSHCTTVYHYDTISIRWIIRWIILWNIYIKGSKYRMVIILCIVDTNRYTIYLWILPRWILYPIGYYFIGYYPIRYIS